MANRFSFHRPGRFSFPRPGRRTARRTAWFFSAIFALALGLCAREPADLPPVVLVPGAPASELYDPENGERIWPNAKLMIGRHGADRLMLPLDNPEAGRADASALLRRVKFLALSFNADVYQPFEAKLIAQGYRQGDWNHPTGEGEYFIWPYDWRLGIESNGRRLFEALQNLQSRQADGPHRFLMVGHSLGGQIIRYALMYGDTPLGLDGPLPAVSWKGSALMREAFLVATPNGGSFIAIDYMHRGSYWHWGWGAFAPHETFTFPALFDLLPVESVPFIDLDGKPLDWDLNDPATWEALKLSVFDPKKRRGMTLEEARSHLRSELSRRARLQAALRQNGALDNPVPLHLFGGDCSPVLRTAWVGEGRRGPELHFSPAGDREQKARLATLIYEPGDAMIASRSLQATGWEAPANGSLHFVTSDAICEVHHHMTSNPAFIARILSALKPDTRVAASVPPANPASRATPAAVSPVELTR